jgi:Ala-tRNA(Pro) deacylase
MTDIYQFLSTCEIPYERHDHPPVYTVADVHRLVPDLPAPKTKNLFLRDGPGKMHFLVVVPGDKRVNIKALASLLGAKRLSFGSPDRLKKHLGVDPGSVSLLAVVNDAAHNVKVAIDRVLWNAPAFQFHPLVNTATLVIPKQGIVRFLDGTGHEPVIVDVPE